MFSLNYFLHKFVKRIWFSYRIEVSVNVPKCIQISNTFIYLQNMTPWATYMLAHEMLYHFIILLKL